MPWICILDVVVVTFYLYVAVQSSELWYTPRRHREHIFTSSVRYNESLVWAVILNVSYLDDEDISSAAEVIAADTGLVNHGQIGSLREYYVFSHPTQAGRKHSSVSSLLFVNHEATIFQSDHLSIKDGVHRMLDNHPFVEWYMLQRVSPRFKRSTASKSLTVHFNDPFYHKQWHLVGISF